MLGEGSTVSLSGARSPRALPARSAAVRGASAARRPVAAGQPIPRRMLDGGREPARRGFRHTRTQQRRSEMSEALESEAFEGLESESESESESEAAPRVGGWRTPSRATGRGLYTPRPSTNAVSQV